MQVIFIIIIPGTISNELPDIDRQSSFIFIARYRWKANLGVEYPDKFMQLLTFFVAILKIYDSVTSQRDESIAFNEHYLGSMAICALQV